MDLISILKHPDVSLVDVREPYEFVRGHAQGAKNIPLSTLFQHLDEFRQMSGPIVLYCRSGSRSGQARMLLQAQGIREVYNGGGVEDVEYALVRARRAAA